MDDRPHPIRLCWDRFRLTAFITYCSALRNLYLSPYPHTRADLYSHGDPHAYTYPASAGDQRNAGAGLSRQ